VCIVFILWVQAVYAESVIVTYDDANDRLGLRAMNAPLSLVLSHIAEETGIELRFESSAVNEQLSLDQVPVATELVLRTLLRHHSYMLSYGEQDGRRYIESLILLPDDTPAGAISSLDHDIGTSTGGLSSTLANNTMKSDVSTPSVLVDNQRWSPEAMPENSTETQHATTALMYKAPPRIDDPRDAVLQDSSQVRDVVDCVGDQGC